MEVIAFNVPYLVKHDSGQRERELKVGGETKLRIFYELWTSGLLAKSSGSAKFLKNRHCFAFLLCLDLNLIIKK